MKLPNPTSNSEDRIFTVPNILTFVRILSIPFVVYLLSSVEHPSERRLFWAAVIFGVAFLTDQFDGIIARTTNQITRLGKILDPLADKILVIAALLLLVHLHFVEVWLAVVLSARELVVNALRAIAQAEGITLSPNWVGKTKVYFEGFGIAFVMLGPTRGFWGVPWMKWGTILLYLAALTALISAAQYFHRYYQESKFPGPK